MPERQVPAEPVSFPSPVPRTARAAAAGEAVTEILACAEIAVAAIGRQAQAQAREITARAEARPAEEAERRRAHLERLRGELAERAATLALSYGSILEELGAIDRMLAGEAEAPAGESQAATEPDPRVAAIRMTLRERRRIEVPAEDGGIPAAPWVEAAPTIKESTREEWPVWVDGQWREPEPWPPEVQAPRRRWRLWQRAA